ncbi:MAG: AMP-binding protein, partial [Pseudolabrys sp.]
MSQSPLSSFDDRPTSSRFKTLLSSGGSDDAVPAEWGRWHASAVAGRDVDWQIRHLTIPQLLLARACERPRDVAYRQKRMGVHDEWTWLRVIRHVARAAEFFDRHGIGPGRRVIFVGDPSIDVVVLQMAALACGATVVNLYPSHSASDLARLIDLARPAMIVVDRQDQIDKILGASEAHAAIPILSFDGRVRSLHRDRNVFFHADIAADETPVLPPDFLRRLASVSRNSPAFLIFTNFSAGAPVGMTQTHTGYLHVLNNFAALDPALREKPQTTVAVMPMAHVFGQAVAYLPILSRAITHFPEDAAEGMSLLRDVSPDLVLLAPIYFRKLSSMLLSELRSTRGLKKA